MRQWTLLQRDKFNKVVLRLFTSVTVDSYALRRFMWIEHAFLPPSNESDSLKWLWGFIN